MTTQPRPSDSFILSFSELTEASPSRRRDAVLRALDILLSALFLVVSLPATFLIALATVLTSGLPLFYRGERIGRGARIFHMLKFRTLRRGAEERLGPFLGEELMRRTRRETTWLGGWLRATQLDEIPHTGRSLETSLKEGFRSVRAHPTRSVENHARSLLSILSQCTRRAFRDRVHELDRGCGLDVAPLS